MNTMDTLIETACNMAMHGAREYLTRHNLTADADALSHCLKAWVKIQLPIALRDAKEAIDCHMTQVAETTFTASMIQAGIEAAKESSKLPALP